MIEPGRHVGRAVEADMGRTGNGTDQIGIGFEFKDGSRLTWYGFFTEAAMEITCDGLKSLGSDPADLDWDMDEVCKRVIGKETMCQVVESEYEGKRQLRINFIGDRGGIAMKERMDEKDRADFRSRMKAMMGGAKTEGAPF